MNLPKLPSSDNLKLGARVTAAGGLGIHVGNLMVWWLNAGLSIDTPDKIEASILGICAIAVGWALKD